MNFSPAIFFKKVREAANRRGMKIGALEEAAGVSQGYMARSEKVSSNPSMAFVINVADALDCSIDFLVASKPPCFTDIDLVIHDFLRKLQSDTSAGKLAWSMKDDVCSATFIDNAIIYVSGALIAGPWKQVRIWIESASNPAGPAGDAVGNAEAIETIMYDESINKNQALCHMAHDTVLLVRAYAESQVKPDAMAIMKEYLSGS